MFDVLRQKIEKIISNCFLVSPIIAKPLVTSVVWPQNNWGSLELEKPFCANLK